MFPWLLTSLRRFRAGITSTFGWRGLKRLCRDGKAPISVFFYHRVANQSLNPWTITEQEFFRQIQLFRKDFEILGLEEVQRRIEQCDSHNPAVAITFDDGYADNSEYALPLLTRLGIPCTYFVTLDNIHYGTPFQHDLRLGTPLLANTIEEIRYWSEQGVEIGLHTRSHHDFSIADDEATIEREVITAADELRTWIGKPVDYFAFPFGTPAQITPAVQRAVKRIGMKGFCSAYGAYNVPGDDCFHIRRIHGDGDLDRFRNWLYFDRCKLWTAPQLRGELPRNGTPSTESSAGEQRMSEKPLVANAGIPASPAS